VRQFFKNTIQQVPRTSQLQADYCRANGKKIVFGDKFIIPDYFEIGKAKVLDNFAEMIKDLGYPKSVLSTFTRLAYHNHNQVMKFIFMLHAKDAKQKDREIPILHVV